MKYEQIIVNEIIGKYNKSTMKEEDGNSMEQSSSFHHKPHNQFNNY